MIWLVLAFIFWTLACHAAGIAIGLSISIHVLRKEQEESEDD